MAARGCSKCKVNEPGHFLRNCDKKWPFWEDQVCDRCLKVHDHDFKNCKSGELAQLCKHCGHEGNHNSKDCKIKDKDNDEHVRQWTKVKYEEAMLKREKARIEVAAKSSTTKNLSGKASASTQGSNRGLPSHPKSGTASASGVRKSTTQSTSSIRRRPEFKRAYLKIPAPTPEQAQKQSWALENLNLAPFSTSTASKSKTATSNFFKIDMKKDVAIHKYRIVLGKVGEWDVTKREVKRALIQSILQDSQPTAVTWVCDYFSHIISVGRLYEFMREEADACWSCVHQRQDVGGGFVNMTSAFHYEGSLRWDKVRNYIDPSTTRDDSYLPEGDFQILNLLSWKNIYDIASPTGGVNIVGKKFYPESTKGWNMKASWMNSKFGQVAIIRRGFLSSVRPGNGSLYLNVNTATTAFYPEENLYDYMKKRRDTPANALNTEFKQLRVTFLGDDPIKTRVISGILDATETSAVKIFAFGNETRTVIDHIRIKYPFLAGTLHDDARCIAVGSMKDGTQIIYPADTLIFLPWQPFKGKMIHTMTSDMLAYAKKNPDENEALILNEARTHLGIIDKGLAKRFYPTFGLSIGVNFTKVEYHSLIAPHIRFREGGQGYFDLDIYGSSRTHKEDQGQPPKKLPARDSASWNLSQIATVRSRSFLQVPSGNKNLAIIGLRYPSSDEAFTKPQKTQVPQFACNFINSLKAYGIYFNFEFLHSFLSIPSGPTIGSRRRSLADALSRSIKAGVDFVIFALPDTNAESYSNIRWWADCEAGIPILCVTPDILDLGAVQNDRGVFGNLSLKTNYRLGGIVHSLRDPLPVRGTTMIVGADVTHPGKVNDTTCPSMAGVVATYDTYYMTYLASARLQKKNTEHISDLKGMMKERLHAYKSKNGGSLPEHILFYRDGVSESQFGEVRATELPQIIEACKEEAGAVPRPRITLVIVIKRHHSRFFPNPENRQNNKSGLLVDETVVAPKQFNFYLQAHDSPIGTARNTHYVVLENESGYNADELQSITNKLSFTASKGTKGLSVCTPARYADTLCDRLRRYMRPALELDRSVNYPNYPDHTLINYNHDVVIWNAPRAAIKVNGRTTVEARTNPWRPELNDFMFYL